MDKAKKTKSLWKTDDGQKVLKAAMLSKGIQDVDIESCEDGIAEKIVREWLAENRIDVYLCDWRKVKRIAWGISSEVHVERRIFDDYAQAQIVAGTHILG